MKDRPITEEEHKSYSVDVMMRYAKHLTFFASIGLAWYWFGWKLVVILMLWGWFSNLERRLNG